MSNQAKKPRIFQFGKHGWGIILFCLFLFFFYGAFVTDGINITAEYLAQRMNTQAGTVISMNTIAGLVGVLFFVAIGQVNHSLGPRITGGICLIVGSAAYIVTGNTGSLAIYTVAMCFVTGTIMSATYIVGGTLTARWFPKTKGVVMGYTTMGLCFSSAFYVMLIAVLIGRLGIGGGVVFPGIAGMVLGVICLVLVRNDPRELGVNPDNVSDEVYAKEYCTDEQVDRDGGWTTGKLLGTREMWMSALCSAIPTFCTVGVMSQLITRNMGLGMDIGTALGIMTALSLLSIPGSLLVGILDDRLGTRKAMTLFMIWYIVALLLNFSNLMPCVYLSLAMFAVTTGGGGNFTVSLPASVFGRHGFDKVNSVVFPIQGFITALNYTINGVILNLTGGVRYSYIVFAVLCVINIVLLQTFDAKKYNRDFAAENDV